MTFSSALKKANKRTMEKTDKLFRVTTVNVMNRIVRRTPVDTGRLRANWNVSINQPDTTVSESKTSGPNNQELQAGLESLTTGDTAYFTNNMPYAEFIENGGSTVKAPLGMLKVSVMEAEL